MSRLAFMFIVFEGLDKAGKTTISELVHTKLSNLALVERIAFPNRTTPIGRVIDETLSRKIQMNAQALHLLFSANRYEFAGEIAKLRKKGILLCDRYFWSGITSSAARGVSYEWAKSTEQLLPKPDLTVFIDCNVDVVCNRSGFGDEEFETVEYQKQAYEYYMRARKEDDRPWLIVDGNCEPEEIADAVVKRITSPQC